MQLIDLKSVYNWKKFKGRSIIYMLRWGGKNYIGGTDDIKGRVKTWRQKLKCMYAEIRILLMCEKKDRDFYERSVIRVYGTAEKGHNKTNSGKGGHVTGTKFSKTHCENISKARLGMKFTKEHCENIKKSRTGLVPSQETRKKISDSLLGNKRAFGNGSAIQKIWEGRNRKERAAIALKGWSTRRLRKSENDGLI